MMARIVFMGSPEFALPILRKLADQYQIVGVITQPDRPSGRGRILTSPPIKNLANELHLPILQPVRLSQPDALQQLYTWSPDLIVVAAFGQILRSEILELPEFGCVNVHASLLPRWRGAAPIQAAILNGDTESGITIMHIDPGIDTGPIINQRSIPIEPQENAGSLANKLSILGANLLIETLPNYLSGTLKPYPQDNSKATYAPMLTKEAGRLDFSQSAQVLERKVRAFNPWPGTFTLWKDKILKIHKAHFVECAADQNGKQIIFQGLPSITTGDGILVFDELQPAGKKSMSGKIFLQGIRNWAD